MLFDVSQIEFLLHALQIWLRGLFDLIVIIFEPCSCSTGCSKGHLIGTVVTSTLLTRPDTHWLLTISSSEEVVPRWQWDQTGHWVLSHTWRACNKNSIWVASESFLTDVTYVLFLRVIMLNNNVKILLMWFVHHIKLQNFFEHPTYLCQVVVQTAQSTDVVHLLIALLKRLCD